MAREPTTVDDNRLREGGTPGFTTFHLHASYRTKDVVVRLNFDNLTEELVLEHGSGFYRPGFSTSIAVNAF